MNNESTTTSEVEAGQQFRVNEMIIVPDELCPHVEMGAEIVGGFIFAAEKPQKSVGMCELCLAICRAEFTTAEPWVTGEAIK